MTSVSAMPRTAAPPTPQEVSRKLSLYKKPAKKPVLSALSPPDPHSLSGNDSESDSLMTPDISHSSFSLSSSMGSSSGGVVGTVGVPSTSLQMNPPLSVIAEAPDRVVSGGEDSDDDDEEGWRVADQIAQGKDGKSVVQEENFIKSGYLWKKGERRKTWKKRWFVLRSSHLAYYKNSAEYELLRLLDMSEIHSVTPCSLKRHSNTFGLVSPSRTFYLQAESSREVESWVGALNEVREALITTSTLTALTLEAPTPTPAHAPTPIPIPQAQGNTSLDGSQGISPPTGPPSSTSPLSRQSYSPGGQAFTSSDDEELSAAPSKMSVGWTPSTQNVVPPAAALTLSPSKQAAQHAAQMKDPTKTVISGYLMKCSSRRRVWRKRWFVLNGQKLTYAGSHMDTKHAREIPLENILDALEFDAFASGSHGLSSTPSTHHSSHLGSAFSGASDENGGEPQRTFKIITTTRTLLLSAPSELEEIKWLSTVRALIARRSSSGSQLQQEPQPRGGSQHGAKSKGTEGVEMHHSRDRSKSSSGSIIGAVLQGR